MYVIKDTVRIVWYWWGGVAFRRVPVCNRGSYVEGTDEFRQSVACRWRVVSSTRPSGRRSRGDTQTVAADTSDNRRSGTSGSYSLQPVRSSTPRTVVECRTLVFPRVLQRMPIRHFWSSVCPVSIQLYLIYNSVCPQRYNSLCISRDTERHIIILIQV